MNKINNKITKKLKEHTIKIKKRFKVKEIFDAQIKVKTKRSDIDILFHEYLDKDYKLFWNIVKNKIPLLHKKIKNYVKGIKEKRNLTGGLKCSSL